MNLITDTVAIATMSSRVCETRDTAVPRASAIAALKVTGPPDALAFALHTHVPASAARLTAWIDALVVNDPLLVGHRLARTSRLLIASGYTRNLSATFNHTGRCEILDVVRGRPTPLSAAALLNGVMAVDEEALVHRRPINTGIAANLALINAVASWVIHVRRSTPGRGNASLQRRVLGQLVDALHEGPAPALVIAAMTCPVQ
jgi:hypothetical protein